MNWVHIIFDIGASIMFISVNEFVRRTGRFTKIGHAMVLGWILFTMISTTCFASHEMPPDLRCYYEQLFEEIELRAKSPQEFFQDAEIKRTKHRDKALELIDKSQEMASEHLDDAKCLAYKTVVSPFICLLDGNKSVQTMFFVAISNIVGDSYSILNSYDNFRTLCMEIDYEIGMYDFYTSMIEKNKNER